MTKNREINLLDETIARFGRDSYLGPWLAEIRDTLVRQIESDFTPDAPTPAELQKAAQDALRAAQVDAEHVKRAANEQAEALVFRAKDRAAQITSDARRDIERAIDALAQKARAL